MISGAVGQIRTGSGPWLLEFSVYRWREHCGPEYDNHIGYRTPEEFDSWKSREPIAQMQKALRNLGVDVDAWESEALTELGSEVQAAFDFAESSPFPGTEEAFIGEYA